MKYYKGWLKLHRKVLENPTVMKSPEHLAVWVYLLCHAATQPYKTLFAGNEVELRPGQLITGRDSIAKSFARNLKGYQVQRILTCFENAHLIAQRTGNQNRLITVLEWESAQKTAQQNRQQLHNNRTTTAQQLHTNKEYKEEKERKESKKSEMSLDELWENADRRNGHV